MSNEVTIPNEIITNKIYLIRNEKVMLDNDLAELYQVETKRLNERVKRNIERFPDDFMFQLSKEEWINLKSQFATSSWGGRRKEPFVFTEYGILMLSSVLNSERAIAVNIQIIRVFSKMREVLSSHKDLLLKMEGLEQKAFSHDEQLLLIFEYLKEFEETKKQEVKQNNRSKIGYK